MKKIFLLITLLFVVVGCSLKKEDIPCYNSEEFKEAIKVLNDTESISIFRRHFNDDNREIYYEKIIDINKDKVDKIVNILINSNEWTGPVITPFPPYELRFYNIDEEVIATYIYFGASDLVIGDKTYVLTDFDKEALDMLISNMDTKLKL